MLVRLTSLSLLIIVAALGITGTAVLIAPLPRFVMDAHRFLGWVLLAILPFKAVVVARSIQRGVRRTLSDNMIVTFSIILAALLLIAIALPLLWLLGIEFLEGLPGWRTVHLHWLVGLGLVLPLAIHVWQRWLTPRARDFTSRRSVLSGVGVLAGGAAFYALFNRAGGRLFSLPPTRPSTGSREENSFQGNALPVTTNPGSGLIRIEAEDWRLTIRGLVARPFNLSLSDIRALPPHQASPILDCTVGWYSQQIWSGVPLIDLLRIAEPDDRVRYVSLVGVSGYRKDIPMGEARQILLATHVGGEPISHPHGAPLRAVVPTRRGWFWVKWLVEIQLRRDPNFGETAGSPEPGTATHHPASRLSAW